MLNHKKIKICIIRNDRMGDMILTLPIIKEIKKKIPNSHIKVVCSNINYFLCQEAKFVDEFCIYDNKMSFLSKMKFLKNIKKDSYDYLFNFCQSIESFLILLLSKSKIKSTLIYLSRYKNPCRSKNFQKFISRILNINNLIINRRKLFKTKNNFHQTNIMFELVNKKIPIRNPKNFVFLPENYQIEKNSEKRILLHLSNRWIDENYDEDQFIELLEKLKKKSKLYLTTDHSSASSFDVVLKKYIKLNDASFNELPVYEDNIIILDKLNFKNWRKIILNSKLVITYECGCSHVTAMSNIPLIIIYDFKNEPFMIHDEYSPLTKKYEKVIVTQNLINQEIMSKLKQIEI